MESPSPLRKAQFLVRGCMILHRLGFRRVFLYSFFDEGVDPTCSESLYGVVSRDLQKKPAYHALDQLINHEWKTSLDAKASAGKVPFRGFRGRYRLTWKGADGKPRTKTVELK